MRNIIRTSHDARRRSSGLSGSDSPQGSPLNIRRPYGSAAFILPRRASSSLFELSSRRNSGPNSESLPKIKEHGVHSVNHSTTDCSVQTEASPLGHFMRQRSLEVIKFTSSREEKSLFSKRHRKQDFSQRIKKRRIVAMLTIIVTFLLFVVFLTIYVKKLIKDYYK